MAKSFFERLTGSVRVSGNGDDKVSPVSRAPLLRPTGAQAVKTRKKSEPADEDRKVIHPVGLGEGEESPDVFEEPVEEGELQVDIYDDGSHIVIQTTVAGVKPEDIDISLQEETLTIRGSRRRASEIKDADFYYRELYWGSFSRSIILPEEVDFQKAEASMKNGLLTIKLPKKDKGEKKIRVKVE